MKRWLVPALLVVVGLVAAVEQVRQGESATALGTPGAGGAVWGLYVVADGFLVGASLSALLFAGGVRLLRRRAWEDAAVVATAVATIGLALSALCVLADSGRPLRTLTVLPLVGRAQSPFFGTFTLVVGASLSTSLLQTLLAVRARIGFWGWQNTPAEHWRRERSAFWLSLFTLPLAVLGLVIMASVFAARPGRPPLVEALELASFVVLAAASGLALLALVLAAAGRLTVVRPLARALLLLAATGLLLVVASENAAVHSAWPAARRYGIAVCSGDWRIAFWLQLVLLLAAGAALWLQLWRRSLSWRGLRLWSAVILVAVFIHREVQLVAWQTHGLGLSYPAGRYSPTWIEIGVTVGIFGLGVLLFWGSLRLLPAGAPAPAIAVPLAPVSCSRRALTLALVGLGAVMATLGLALSAHWGVERFSDPRVPGSPLLFLGGLVTMAVAALPYELLRDRAPAVIQTESQSARG